MKTQSKSKQWKQQWQVHFVLLAACLGLLSGCEYVRHITVMPGRGGVLAVYPPHNPEIRQRAKDAMERICEGRRPRVVKEGAVVVGRVNNSYTSATAKKHRRSRSVSASSSTTSSSYNVTQWRIAYICQKRRRYSRRSRRRYRRRRARRRPRRARRYSRRKRYGKDQRRNRDRWGSRRGTRQTSRY